MYLFYRLKYTCVIELSLKNEDGLQLFNIHKYFHRDALFSYIRIIICLIIRLRTNGHGNPCKHKREEKRNFDDHSYKDKTRCGLIVKQASDEHPVFRSAENGAHPVRHPSIKTFEHPHPSIRRGKCDGGKEDKKFLF